VLYEKLLNDSRFKTIIEPELDIVVWAPNAERATMISKLSTEVFKFAASNNLHLAIFNYPTKLLRKHFFQNVNHIQIQEGHTARSELLIAPDCMKVACPAQFLQRTATASFEENSVIAQ